MNEILAAVAILHQGEVERARERLLELWDARSTTGDPQQLSTVAHFLADTETDVAAELEWDLRALEAATGSRAEDLDALPPVPATFLPSLHLSVGDGYRRLDDPASARRHGRFAAARAAALPDDGYGNMIRGAIRRLEARLDGA